MNPADDLPRKPARRPRPIDGSSFVEGDRVTDVPAVAGAGEETRRPPGAPGAAEPPASMSDSALLRAVAPPLPPEVASAPGAARFGKFVRVKKLGQGGMGEVWQAWDVPLGRWVALKFLTGGDETEIARFTQEAHVAGKLAHPNITAVYEVGEAQGRHYIAMQFIEGTTAAKMPRGDRRMLVRVIRDAARAVGEAHRAGVIHRDIKPDNLLVRGARGSSGAADDFHVFVTDFGLARRTEGASGLSLSGAIIGTPSFMPPEQARGEKVDVRADVYALGATLYDLLSGEPPFGGATIFELLRAVQDKDAPSMRARVPAIESDLDTIVLKCLEKDPARRYQTAEDLAADLDRFLEGEAIAARPASLVYRVRRTLWKKRAMVAVGLAGLAAVALTLAAMVPPLLRESRGRESKDRELKLWAGIAGTLNEAELLSRTGALPQSRAKLEEGAKTCRAFLAGEELPIAHYFLGRILRRLGRGAEAEAELSRAIALDAGLGEAHLERGLLRAERFMALADDHERAWIREQGGEFAKLAPAGRVEDDPALAAAAAGVREDLQSEFGQSSYYTKADQQFASAMLAFVSRRNGEVRERLGGILQSDPTYVEAQILLARLNLEAGDYEAARQLAGAAVSQHKGKPAAWTQLALANERLATYHSYDPERQTRINAALDATGQALSLGLANATLLDARGRVLLMSGRSRDALAAFDKALELNPAWDSALLNRGLAKDALGDRKGALADLEEVARLHPASVIALRNLGNVRAGSGNREGALKDYDRAIQAGPKGSPAAETWYCRAMTLAEMGRGPEAEEAYGKAVEADASHEQAWNNRGNLRRARKDFKGALEDYDAAVKAQPRFALAWFNRGQAQMDMGDPKAAVKSFEEALNLTPDWTDALYGRGCAKLDALDAAGAIADFVGVIKANPKSAEAHFNLGNAYGLKNDLELAIREYGESVRINAKYADAWANRARAQFMRGRFDEAAKDFTRQIELEAGNPDGYLGRAEAYIRKGDRKLAIGDLVQAIEMMKDGDARKAPAESKLDALKRTK